MYAVDDGWVAGHLNLADLFFLIAVILFVVYALSGFARTIDVRLHSVLLGLGLACTALGLLIV